MCLCLCLCLYLRLYLYNGGPAHRLPQALGMVGRSFVRDELLSAAADSAERRRPSSPGDSADGAQLYPAGGTKAAAANATAVAARRWQPPPLVANLEAPRKGSSVLVGMAGTRAGVVGGQQRPYPPAGHWRSSDLYRAQQHTAAHSSAFRRVIVGGLDCMLAVCWRLHPACLLQPTPWRCLSLRPSPWAPPSAALF